MHRWITTLCAGWTLLLAALPAAAADLGPVAYHSPEATADLTPTEREELAWLWQADCRVLSLSSAQRQVLDGAVEHVRSVLADRRLQAMIRAKEDWRLADGDAWTVDAAAGQRVLELLDAATSDRRVGIFTYERTPEHPCDLPVANGDIHAYTVDTQPVILFHRAYLQRQVHAEDLDAGRRRLARTLLHETLHVLGFRHPGTVDARAGATYASTVPVWLGCAVEHWPDAEYVRSACHLAEPSRPASAHRDACRPTSRVAGLRTDQEVRVKVRRWWTTAVVREVDATSGRARVRWPSHEHEAWVDGCRIRAERPRTAGVTAPPATR
ncbi:MAG: hypothetical protein ACQEXJ_12010 [Myxococcota bacterium]